MKVRNNGAVFDIAILLAYGVTPEGKREILGASASLSEAEAHWRQFLEHLQSRGMKGVRLIISDDHAGMRKARMGVFPSIPWQRCQFHLSQLYPSIESLLYLVIPTIYPGLAHQKLAESKTLVR